FERTVAKLGYHFQAAFYKLMSKLCGLNHSIVNFVAVEKLPPYGIQLHSLEVVSMGYAYDKNEQALLSLKQCRETGVWPCYSEEIQTITLPMYAMELGEEGL